MLQHFDVVIVGTGVLGLSAAWEFRRQAPHLSVALFSPRSGFPSASATSGAMLSGYAETTAASSRSAAGRLRLGLRAEAAKLWPSWMEELSGQVNAGRPVLGTGTVVITNAASGPMEDRNLREIRARLVADQVRFDEVDCLSDLGLQPSTPFRPMQAIHIAQERYVDSSVTLRLLLAALTQDPKVRIIDDTCVAAGAIEGSRAVRVTGMAESVVAGTVILAAGTSSLDLLDEELARDVPGLFHGSGTALIVEGDAGFELPYCIRTPNRAFSCGLHVIPRGVGTFYVGATNNIRAQGESLPLMSDVAFIADCAMQQVDRRLSRLRIKDTRTASRPLTIDTFPLVGRTRACDLWLLTGTYRDGFLLAPLLAQRLCEAVLRGAPCPQGLEAFAPVREPISVMSPEEALLEGVENFIAIAYERQAALPAVGGWEDELREQLHRKVRGLYEELNLPFVLSPDFLWDIQDPGLRQRVKAYTSG